MTRPTRWIYYTTRPFLKLRKNQYWWSFHIAHKMRMQLNDYCQSSINSPIKSFKWLLKRNPYPVCQIYKGMYGCDAIQNVDIRRNEHEDIHKECEPAKHLRDHLNHKFKCETLLQAPKNYLQRENLEASFIAIMGNNQIDTKKLYLFCNGVTWEFFNLLWIAYMILAFYWFFIIQLFSIAFMLL